MMKKQYLFSLSAALILLLSGCEDFLTHDHPVSVTDELWWNTESDATNALDRVYVGIPDGASGRQLMFLSALSDELVARQSTRGDYESYVLGLQDPTWNKSEHIWIDDFKTIRRAGRFLENIDGVYMDESLKTRYKYEARALRAYYHMELFMLFGAIPIIREAVAPNNSYLAKDTEEDVYKFIVEELEECAGALPLEYTNAEIKRITAGTCLALISRLALFHNDYELAQKAAKEIIDLGIYELYKSGDDGKSYEELFRYTGELNKERIFFRPDGSSGVWNTFAPQGVGGKTILSPTAAIVNAYETKQGKTIWELGPDSLALYMANPDYNNNRDPRLTASVLLPGQTFMNHPLTPFSTSQGYRDKIGGQNSTATGYWVNKYVDPRDRNGTRNLDFMIIRYAEILLNYVEALVETGQWQHPDVVKYLNEIRKRAGMPDVDISTYNSENKMRELVRRERQVELAFEAVRYYDIRRWGIFEEVMNGPVYGAVNPANNQAVLVEERVARNDRDYYWPIPLGEILSNPNMKQNPNY